MYNNNFLDKVKNLLKNGLFWSAIMFAFVVYFMLFGVNNISSNVSSQQLELIANSVRRSAVQCYALEGSYPKDLEYLVQEYNLNYDSESYVIHYRNVGGNLLPEISVFHLEK